MKKSILVIGAVAFALSMSMQAWASKSLTSGDEPVSACASNSLKIATGESGKGYSKIFKDMKAVCGAQVPLCEVASTGGLDNLSLLSNKKADIAEAQLDTLKTMAPGDENVNALQQVMPMNYNYLHVLTSSKGWMLPGEKKWGGMMKGEPVLFRVQKFSDLKTANIAVVGSAALLGPVLNNIFKDKGYNMHFIEKTKDADALAALQTGEVFAVFSVSGIPMGTVGKLTQASGISLVPFDEDVGQPYFVRKINYKNVGAFNIKSLAVPNLLLTRPFGSAKMAQVVALKSCITASLQDLKDGDYEPAWNEMKFDALQDWPSMSAPATQGVPKRK